MGLIKLDMLDCTGYRPITQSSEYVGCRARSTKPSEVKGDELLARGSPSA